MAPRNRSSEQRLDASDHRLRPRLCAEYRWRGLVLGYGKSGQLGTGAITDAPSPQLAGGGHLYASLSSGKATTCGLRKDDNTLWCWGASEYGQFGDVEPASATPKLLIADKDIQLAVGGSHLCVLRADERIECWGGAGYGQTGRGVMATESSPRLVDSGTTWTTVVSYTNGTCAKQTDGSLWCWGKNNSGQLGLGDLANRRIPTKRTESGKLVGGHAERRPWMRDPDQRLEERTLVLGLQPLGTAWNRRRFRIARALATSRRKRRGLGECDRRQRSAAAHSRAVGSCTVGGATNTTR